MNTAGAPPDPIGFDTVRFAGPLLRARDPHTPLIREEPETFRHRSLVLAGGDSSFVLLTDIADFFTRIYSHPLENALRVAVSADHARVITKLISQLNQRVSHGLPVGPAVFRLLADLVIGDVDQALVSEGYTFCRYSDDYRIFVATEREAREACAFLANVLLRNHGLTLQESKTEIIGVAEFIARFERSERDAERARLREEFEGLWDVYRDKHNREVEEATKAEEHDELLALLLQLDDYEIPDYSDLEPEQQQFIDNLNLWSIVREQRDAGPHLDVPMTKFVLRRIAELGLPEPNAEITGDIAPFYSVFPEAIEAIGAQNGLSSDQKEDVGAWLISLFDDDVLGHLEYHRAWILNVFARSAGWNHADELVRLYDRYTDSLTRSGVIRALGVAGVSHWFRSRKADVLEFGPWERRAFLEAARCLPRDEAAHWYRSVAPQLNGLDLRVAQWSLSQL